MTIVPSEAVLGALHAVADAGRLALLRRLNEQAQPVDELVSALQIDQSKIVRDLARLREAGLVSLRTVGGKHVYCINTDGLAKFKAMMADIECAPQPVINDTRWLDALDMPEADKQILRTYTLNGTLTRLPHWEHDDTLVILRWLASLFAPDRHYTELEVNAILRPVYEADFVGLRRDLIDLGYLHRERDGSSYWRAADAS